MSIRRLLTNVRQRGLLSAAVLPALALALFTWQVASAWADQDQQAVYEAAVGIRGLLAGRNAESTELTGTGVSAGARATLYYYERGVIGVMLLYDMPVLPSSHVYEMWFIAPDGDVDASSVFVVPADAQTTTVIDVSAPHAIGEYANILVTIEPSGGSQVPDGPVIMRSR